MLNATAAELLQAIREEVDGTRLLVIGNGELPHEPDVAKYDHICRINRGILTARATLWANGLATSCVPPDGHYRWMLRLNAERNGDRLLAGFRGHVPANTFLWTSREYELATQRMGIPRPMTGTLAVYWLLWNTTARLTVIGCPCYLKGGVPFGCHNPRLDALWLWRVARDYPHRIEWADDVRPETDAKREA